jgi:type VI secretion system protein ImpG
MSEELYPYYQDELYFIRQLAKEFGKKYPAAAGRLQLEPDGSANKDPHVERLIEAFALLCGRIRHKIHDEFPELTDAVLSVVYPHALAPVPSFATVRFEADPNRPPPPEGVHLPAGSRLQTDRVGGLACQFRTCYPVALWPVELVEAKLERPPFPSGLKAPAGAATALRLRLRVAGEQPFDKLAFSALRFHLHGDATLTAPLYDLLHNHAVGVVIASPDPPKAAVSVPAAEAIRPVGFEPGDAVLPYPDNVFPGYRLLTEYFAYPDKFLYVDLGGWAAARAALGPVRQVEAVVFLDRGHPRLEQLLDARMLRTGCAPAINLFEKDAEGIELKHTRPEYPLTPEVGHPTGFEVYAVTEVKAAGPAGDVAYEPFYHYRHGGPRGDRTAFWYATRRPGLGHDDRGTDVSLHLVDGGFDPAAPGGETLVVRTLCTNRDLPTRLPRVGEEVRFHLGFAAPGVSVRSVRNPTGSLRPAAPRNRYWHLISHLNLNHLSLTGDAAGTDALKALLRLYDLTDPAAEPRAAALARAAVDGVLRVAHRRTTAWVRSDEPDEPGGFARGLEVALELDEDKFAEVSAVLFASVLERFFGLYASINSFSQLVARFRQRDGVLKKWPPRAGDRPLG